MVSGMTLDQQLEDARKALDELTADEAELSRLQSEQVAEISALKASGSRDFAGLATLEGKRAALASMLTEQRASIDTARMEVTRLETQQARSEGVSALREQVAGLTARRATVDALLTEMADTLASHLTRIADERAAWYDEQQKALGETAAVFGLPHMANVRGNDAGEMNARAGWGAAFNELGEGAALALTLSPVTRYSGSMFQGYAAPEAARHGPDVVDAARHRPLLGYFDRPVSLTLARVISEADRAAPHVVKAHEV